MTRHNQEERGSTPEKRQMLNGYGVEQVYNADQVNYLCRQLVWSSCWQQYPEVLRRLQAQANQQAQDALSKMGQGATQGEVVHTPGQWSPRQEIREDAPQGPFDQEFIRQEIANPEFTDLLHDGQANLSSKEDIRSYTDRGVDEIDTFLGEQAGIQQLEDA